MNRRVIYGVIAAIIIIILAVIVSIFGPASQTASITLPTPAAEGGALTGDASGLLVITPETVCSALSMLTRTESFSRTYSVKTYWDGGESEDSISVWQKGNHVRMSISRGGSIKNILILENELYLWYEGTSGVLKTTLEDGDYTQVDRFARLISYEQLLYTDAEHITDAGYVDRLNEPCIFIEYTSSDNYVNRVYVSVDSGLLVASEKLENDKLVISMEAVSTELSTPSDDVFAVPTA